MLVLLLVLPLVLLLLLQLVVIHLLASASIVLVIPGSTSDIYNILYILSIFLYSLSIWTN